MQKGEVERFWDPLVMKKWQDYLNHSNLERDFYLDLDNILHLRATDQSIAYVGGVPEKAEKGLLLTNDLRPYTSSFQYIFGLTNPIQRQDNIHIGGTISELIAEDNIEDWLQKNSFSLKSQQQIYSIIMQLYYAAYLLAEKGWNVEKALLGIKIRQVDDVSTVPFFNGSIKTYGVVPVIFELDKLSPIPDMINSADIVIPYILNLVSTYNHWSDSWNLFADNYQKIDPKDGLQWNNLVGNNIYMTETATLTCSGRSCPGEEMGPTNANGHQLNGKETRFKRDLHLFSSTLYPLPEQIQPYALAFQDELSSLYPNDSRFSIQEKVGSTFIKDYLNLSQVQNIYLGVNNDLFTLIQDRDKAYRRFINFDLDINSIIGQFFLREDYIIPALENGDVYTFDQGTVVERYDPMADTFTVRHDDETIILDYEDFFDYIFQVEGVEPYTYQVIPRQHIAIIENEVSYINRETGELYPLSTNRLYVRNIGSVIELIYNAESFLALALSYLYDKSS